MSNDADQQDRPKTINVDELIRMPPALPTLGVLFALAGWCLRCFSRWLAWPEHWNYSGDRANTIWAYREALFNDLGLVALVFGLSLIWLAIARRRPK